MKRKPLSINSSVFGILANRASAAGKLSHLQKQADQVMRDIIAQSAQRLIFDLTSGTVIYKTSNAIDGEPVVQSITASDLFKESA